MAPAARDARPLRWPAPAIPATVRWDLLMTIGVDGLTLLSGLLLFHLVAQRAGVHGFAYYQVARGMVATLQPLAMIGLLVGLQRYLPRAGATARSLGRRAFLVQVAVITAIGLVGSLFAPRLGELLGIPGGGDAVRVVFVALAGTCVWALSVGALRGSGQVARANVSWLLGLGIIPIGAFLLVDDVATFLAAQGIAMTVLALWGVATAAPRSTSTDQHPDRRSPPTLRTVMCYGVRRTPGDVALPALFAFPTFFVAGAGGGAHAGYVGFTASAVTLVCASFGMLTPVLLPRLSRHLSRPVVPPALWTGLRLLPLAAALAAAVIAAVLAATAPLLVREFLGAQFGAAVPVLRLGLVAAVPLAAFYAARPTLDALQDSPVTVKLLLVCFALEVAVCHLAEALVSPAVAAVVGFTVAASALGALSYAALLRAVREREDRAK